MYFLQGLLVGLATFAPVGMQNLFIINTALVQPVRRIILTLIILAFFDMSLSSAAFYGIGAVLEMWPLTKLIVLLFGGLLIVYMGFNIFKTEPDMRNVDTHIPIRTTAINTIFFILYSFFSLYYCFFIFSRTSASNLPFFSISISNLYGGTVFAPFSGVKAT